MNVAANRAATRPAWSVLPVALLTVVPLAVVLASWLQPQPEIWEHLRAFVLPAVLANTLWMAAGVALLTLVLGISLAWLTAVCEFPGRRFFAWALVLPLALPGYVLASVMVGLLDYSGPLQTALRSVFGPGMALPNVRSVGGAVAVFGLVLYPYVYLLARQAFLTQGQRSLEAAQTLGLPRVRAFFRVALPMSRPWWAAGVSLALMEMLADFGTVAIFNVDTFTTAIYKAWLSLFNLAVASQLASLLALAVLLLIWFEQRARQQRRYTGAAAGKMQRIPLRGATRLFAVGWCALVLMLAFVVPVAQLLVWTAGVVRGDWDERYWGFIGHSLMLSALAALLVVGCGLWVAYAQRQHPGRITGWSVRVSMLGYALPGMLLSVGLFVPIAWLDRQLLPWWAALGIAPAPVLKGTLVVMLLALAARFMAVGFEPMQAAMERITPAQEQAARSLGLGRWQVLRRLFVPMLRSGWLGASLLVFVEVMKEMPITLMTRPFGWDTLAVRVFEMSSEGMWERAALPSLCIVAAGLLPVLLLVRATEK
ncbi:MAG: iron ABC transporter permease [Burkholderiaceae bacterium]|nr:iron ABC transporter permease [Burkholderiaceae bacterium]